MIELIFGAAAERNALRTPERDALVFQGRRLSWRSFEERTARIASGLLGAGLRPGNPVATLFGNSDTAVLTLWALARAGIPIVSIHPQTTAVEAGLLIDDAGCRAVLADPAHAETARMASGHGIALWCDGPPEADRCPLPMVRETDVLRLQYTSGTTGRPKGAVQTHRSQVLLMILLALESRMGSESRGLTASTLTSHGGFIQSFIPMWLGGTLVLHKRFEAVAVLESIASERVTSTFMVPTLFNALIAEMEAAPSRYDVSSLEVVMTGSAPRAAAVRRGMLKHFPRARIFEMYGSTECGMATVLKPEDQVRKMGTVGRPAVGSRVEIRKGEIWVSTPTLADGYSGMPEATAAAFVDGWHRTGDMGRLDEEGYLQLLDRRDDLIISGGLNVYPAEVESALYDHEAVLEACVVGVPSERWGSEVVAVVVPREDATIDAPGVREFARERLAGYKAPKRVIVWDSLPKSAAGKILRREVRDRLARDSGTPVASA